MKIAFLIASKDLRQRLRDKSAIVFSFIAPFGLALIITLAFGGADFSFNATYAIADLDGGDAAEGFVDGIESGLGDAVKIRLVESEREARQMVELKKASAAFVIPRGFGTALAEGKAISVEVLQGAHAPIGSSVAQGIAETFSNEVNAARLAVATAIESVGPSRVSPQAVQELVRKSSSERIPAQITTGRLGPREYSSASYFGPAMAIFFLSFTVQFGTVGLLEERTNTTLDRLLAGPATPASVVLGKSLGAFALGMVSLAVMATATTVLLDAYWGPPLAVLLLGAATIFAFMGVSAVASTVARTQEGAAGLVGVVMSLFALLGGNFIRITDAPPLMQTLSLGTPNGWAIRGFVDLTTGGGYASVVGPIIALVAIGLVTSTIAVNLGKGMVRR